ncbi:PTS system [Cutibacterium acnes JCM 18918]|nr:PTS system [Cutibacterium acnes JCM 18918]
MLIGIINASGFGTWFTKLLIPLAGNGIAHRPWPHLLAALPVAPARPRSRHRSDHRNSHRRGDRQAQHPSQLGPSSAVRH